MLVIELWVQKRLSRKEGQWSFMVYYKMHVQDKVSFTKKISHSRMNYWRSFSLWWWRIRETSFGTIPREDDQRWRGAKGASSPFDTGSGLKKKERMLRLQCYMQTTTLKHLCIDHKRSQATDENLSNFTSSKSSPSSLPALRGKGKQLVTSSRLSTTNPNKTPWKK